MRACVLIVWLLGAPWAALAAESPHEKRDLAANAALQYWMAFSQMPAMDAEREKIVSEWKTVSLNDPAVQKLVAESQNCIMFLRRGAQFPDCDWGLDYGDGVSMLIPFLGKGRELARLAALNARYQFEQGNKKAVKEDALAMMTLARHMGREPVMICLLVRYLVEDMVVELIASYVPEIKAPPEEVQANWKKLPAAPSLIETLPVEKQYFTLWMVKRLKEEEARKSGAGLELWRNFLSGSEVPEELRQMRSVDEAVKKIESVLPLYDELVTVVGLPKQEFDARYPAFKEKTKKANSLAGTLLPAIDQILAKEQRNQVRLSMLMAAIAVAQGGPAKLQEYKDPFGTGPFEYQATSGGFQLKSKLVYEGQPVTLGAGRAEKPR